MARALNQWHKHQAQCTAVQCTARAMQRTASVTSASGRKTVSACAGRLGTASAASPPVASPPAASPPKRCGPSACHACGAAACRGGVFGEVVRPTLLA